MADDAFVPRAGAVFSADIAVPEHERELRFYSRVLATGEEPLWRDDLLNSHGTPIIGLGELTPALEHLPRQWMPHIQVADVAASVRRALDLDGTVVMHQKDEAGTSQWAVLQDSNGAAFGLIPIVDASSTSSSDQAAAGRIAWLDLTVADASAARNFYRQVVGWSVEDVEMKDGDARYADFNMLGGDGRPAAGICHARGPNAGLPSVWMIYLPVGDLDESLRRVEQEGGTIIKTMRGADGTYAYAAIQDPVGGYFALVPG